MSENRQGTSSFYDSFFQDNYAILKRWALKITQHDRELSEDLLHDVYLRFSQRNDSPADIESMHSYLYATMKNAHTSYLRSRTRAGAVQISFLEHEDPTAPSITVDPSVILKAHDELRAICHFACSRKSTSIAASILILRFIHGYYSAEVARVVNRSRNAVEARLSSVRREVYYLQMSRDDIGSLFAKQRHTLSFKPTRDGDLLTELRETVFDAVEGRCFTNDQLTRAFHQSSSGLDKKELSHLVSCQSCLDEVNRRLRMPLLNERHPLDSVGSQTVIEVLERGASRAAAAGI